MSRFRLKFRSINLSRSGSLPKHAENVSALDGSREKEFYRAREQETMYQMPHVPQFWRIKRAVAAPWEFQSGPIYQWVSAAIRYLITNSGSLLRFKVRRDRVLGRTAPPRRAEMQIAAPREPTKKYNGGLKYGNL